MNRAIKKMNAAKNDFNEAAHYCSGDKEGTRRYAKRCRNRARRQLDRELIAEQF